MKDLDRDCRALPNLLDELNDELEQAKRRHPSSHQPAPDTSRPGTVTPERVRLS